MGIVIIYRLLIVVVLLNFINSFKFTLNSNVKYNNFNNDNSINNKINNNNNNKMISSMIISLSLLSFPLLNSPSYAAVDKSNTLTIYKSGKSPKQEDANDPKKGTKKETSFLRCLSNCKADCQKPGGLYIHLHD